MKKVAIGLFNDIDSANKAIDELQSSGINTKSISVVASENVVKQLNTSELENEDLANGAGAGAVVGGLLGLLAGISAITIPAIGPVLTAGALATALGTTAVGAGLGGMVGALVDLGIPDEEAQAYAEGIKRGNILLSVQGNADEINKAEEIFARNNAIDMQTNATQYAT